MKFFRQLLFICLLIFLGLLGYYKFWFLRMPARTIPGMDKIYVSPANGKVVSVHHWHRDSVLIKKEDLGAIKVWTEDVDTAGTMVSIQMNVFNAHYQRAPSNGKVINENYQKGSFHNAVSMSNEYGIRFENEHNDFLIQTATGKKYKVIQIAGLIARRIESYAKTGDELKQGDVIGLIKLGSQVTLIFPHDVVVVAKKDDIVVDGETVIATDN